MSQAVQTPNATDNAYGQPCVKRVHGRQAGAVL